MQIGIPELVQGSRPNATGMPHDRDSAIAEPIAAFAAAVNSSLGAGSFLSSANVVQLTE